MKKILRKIRFAIVLIMFFLTFFSCSKGGHVYPLLSSILISGRWQLISSTEITNNVVTKRYIGQPSDSLVFPWFFGANGNVGYPPFQSYITGTNTNISYNIPSEGTGNKIDTIVCSPSWKNGYSNMLMVTNYSSGTLLVFNVAITDSNTIEVDSLKHVLPD